MENGTTKLADLTPPRGLPDALWTALLDDLEGESNRFVQAVTDRLHKASLSGDDLAHWPATLTTLRQSLVPNIDDLEMMVRLEDRLHRAERLVVEVMRNLTGTGSQSLSVGGRRQARSSAQSAALSAGSDTDQLQRIVGRLQRAPDTESVLRIALEEIGGLLGAQVAVARLGTRDQLLGIAAADDQS